LLFYAELLREQPKEPCAAIVPVEGAPRGSSPARRRQGAAASRDAFGGPLVERDLRERGAVAIQLTPVEFEMMSPYPTQAA
jgi:hypothetical protein